MFRSLALFSVLCGLVAAGCRDDGGNNFMPVDLSGAVGDMAGGGSVDMKMPTTYNPATIHDIDTGTVTAHQPVKITGAIVTTVVKFFQAKSKTVCRYQVWVQDPKCTTDATYPCGLVVQADGPMVMNGSCPKADMSGTPLANLKQGDLLDVNGFTDAFSNSSSGDGGVAGTVVQHSIDASSATVTASMQALPAPIAISTADQANFRSYDDTANGGWKKYEGMLVKFTDVTIASVNDNTGAFTTCPGATTTCAAPANWGSDFSFLYRFKLGGDGGMFPTAGVHYTSLTGVVDTVFGGSLNATKDLDFQM